MRDYPQYAEVQAIGQRLHALGGIDLMRQAYALAQARLPYPGLNEYWWNDIGGWMA
jgi:hypothetical protein